MKKIIFHSGTPSSDHKKSDSRVMIEEALSAIPENHYFDTESSDIQETSLRQIVSIYAKENNLRFTVKKTSDSTCRVFKLTKI